MYRRTIIYRNGCHGEIRLRAAHGMGVGAGLWFDCRQPYMPAASLNRPVQRAGAVSAQAGRAEPQV